MKKSDFFRLFFRKHEKSCFDQILFKHCMVSFFSFFHELFFILSKTASKSDLKKQIKNSSFFLGQTDIFSQIPILSFEKWKKVTFNDFFLQNMKSCILPKFCVKIDRYHFFRFFLIFWSRMASESHLKN